MNKSSKRTNVQKLTATAMLAGVATVVMFFSFPVPLVPFVKMDFSELPALIAAYAYGPVSGIAVCFIKNAVNLFNTTSGGIGELCNFLLGITFVVPAGVIYSKMKNKKGAFVGAFVGAISMAVLSVFINYYITYPFYTSFMPMEGIMATYKAIIPSIDNLWQALIIFNMPFTFVKGMASLAISMLIYKPISRILDQVTRVSRK